MYKPTGAGSSQPHKTKSDMNKIGRKQIEAIINKLESLRDEIETLKDEEQEKYDNLPDSLQDSERGETFTDNVDNMETAYDSLDEAIGYLQEIFDR